MALAGSYAVGLVYLGDLALGPNGLDRMQTVGAGASLRDTPLLVLITLLGVSAVANATAWIDYRLLDKVDAARAAVTSDAALASLGRIEQLTPRGSVDSRPV